MRLITVIAAVILSFAPAFLHAETTVSFSANTQRMDLAHTVAIAVDTNGDWTIDDAIRASYTVQNQGRIGFFDHGEAVWVKQSIENTGDESLSAVLDTGDYAPDYVDQFVVDARSKSVLSHARSGMSRPYGEREIQSHHIAFPLHLPAQQPMDVYLRIQSKTRIQIVPALFSERAFQRMEHLFDVGVYTCYGGLTALIVYLIILTLASRDVSLVYFIAFMSTWGLYNAILEGLLVPLFPYHWGIEIHSNYLITAAIFPVVSLSLMTSHYLQTRQAYPYAHWLLPAIAVVTGIICFIMIFEWIPFRHLRIAVMLCVATSIATNCVISARMAIDGNRAARFYAIASTLMFVFVLNAIHQFVRQGGLYTDASVWLRLTYVVPLLVFAAGLGQRMSDLRVMNVAIMQRAAQAQEQAAFKNRFLATMSHEIRTPMNGVLGPVDLLRQTPLTSEQSEYVKIIETSGKTLLNVVNAILDYSKLEAGKVTLDVSAFSLRDLLDECAATFSVHPKASVVQFELSVAKNVATLVQGDANRLRQILLNLINNAFKFTQVGSVKLIVRTVVSALGDSNLIEFAVIDTGSGISKAELGKLFTEYHQVISATQRHSTGTGLGLSICRQLVELMQGTIDVSSELGTGSTFRFRVPLRPVTADKRVPVPG